MQAHAIAPSRCNESRRRTAFLSSALLLAALTMPLHAANAADAQVARGKYLVGLMSCTDCHTPGHFLGKEDATKYLGGSDVGFAIPGLGVFVGPNLTPDKDTGLGNWTPAQIATALTKGQTPDGRILAPPMPWRNYASITKADALAIAAYLKTLPPVSHQVPGPFGPRETPTTFVMTVQPGSVYARLVNPPSPPPPPPASPQPSPLPPAPPEIAAPPPGLPAAPSPDLK
jgi:mono/diheme cytochrome c family protein